MTPSASGHSPPSGPTHCRVGVNVGMVTPPTSMSPWPAMLTQISMSMETIQVGGEGRELLLLGVQIWSCSGFEAAFMMELDFVTEFDFASHSAFVSGLFASDVECDKTIYM